MTHVDTSILFEGIEIQDFDIRPDGRVAICSVNEGDNWELAKLDLKTGMIRRFLSSDRNGHQSLARPRFSRAGDSIVYQTDFEGDEDHDVVVVGSDGRGARRLTDGVKDNFSPEFSPDGSQIAFLSNRDKDVENIFVISSSGGKIRKITYEEMPVGDFAWSPDGSRIAYQTGVFHEDTISVVDVAKGKSKKVLGKRGTTFALAGQYGPSSPWSADGKSVLFLSDGVEPNFIGSLDLTRMKAKPLIKSKHEKYQPQWSPDGRALAYLEVEDPNLLVKVRLGNETRTVSPPDGVSKHVRWSPKGDCLYFINGSAVRREEVYVTKLGRPRKLTDFHKAKLRPGQLACPRTVRYRSFDGRRIPALLFVPRDRSRKAGIVMPHGGPEAQSLNEWDQLTQMLVAKGFAVIQPNYRGSTGYGREFLHLHDHDLGGGDFLDTVYAGKFLLESGLAAQDRLGYWGASYSGFTCMLALGKFPEMWAAAVSIVGFFDWETEMATERGYLKAYDRIKMGDPKKNPAFFKDRSPINFLTNIRAPLLMTASARDVRCPPTESRAIVEKLRRLGKAFEYHEYPDEGHWPRKRRNLRDLYERSARFLDEHMPK